MAKVYQLMANGFEDIEALAPVDILRRGGVEVVMVSVTGEEWVESAHGVKVKADAMIENLNLADADLLMIPGGMPGASNLNEHQDVRKALLQQVERGKKVAAICAAPMVLGSIGVLKNKKATCYPGFEKYLDGAEYTANLVEVDGNITTAKGPAAAMMYGFCLLTQLVSVEKAEEIKTGMLIPELIKLHV